jgi:hypothetical protein
MIPIIAQLGLALVAKKLQDKEAEKAHEEATRRHQSQIKADILGHRAARAGDSGYMQRAMGASANAPQYQGSGSGQMLTQLGAALLSRSDMPDDPDREYGSLAQTKMRRSDFY